MKIHNPIFSMQNSLQMDDGMVSYLPKWPYLTDYSTICCYLSNCYESQMRILTYEQRQVQMSPICQKTTDNGLTNGVFTKSN